MWADIRNQPHVAIPFRCNEYSGSRTDAQNRIEFLPAATPTGATRRRCATPTSWGHGSRKSAGSPMLIYELREAIFAARSRHPWYRAGPRARVLRDGSTAAVDALVRARRRTRYSTCPSRFALVVSEEPHLYKGRNTLTQIAIKEANIRIAAISRSFYMREISRALLETPVAVFAPHGLPCAHAALFFEQRKRRILVLSIS